MTDGTRVVAGIGDVIWTEDVGDDRGKIPRSKLTLGALDTDEGNVSSTNPLPVSGSVSVSNLPSTQTVSGSVSVANFPSTQTVSGSVSVSNLPSTQTVSGSVSVSNLPSTQTVSGSVSVSNFPTTQYPIDPQTRIVREGYLVSTAVSYSNTPATGASVLATASPLTAIGEAFYATAITVGVTRQTELRIQPVYNTALSLGTTGGEFAACFPSGGGVMTIPVNQVWPAQTSLSYVVANETGTALVMRSSISGYRITDDLRYEAAKVLYWVGDSIQRTGPSSGSTSLAFASFQTRDWLRQNGYDYRLLVKAVSGTTSSQCELNRQLGMLDVPKADLIMYQMGANDGSQSVSSATYEANWAAFVTWALYSYPNAHIVMLGTTPAENNTTETNLVALRANMSSFVTALNNSKVVYCNLGSAFDRTVTANYISSDPGGSHIHPSNQGNTAIAGVITSFLNSNRGIL